MAELRGRSGLDGLDGASAFEIAQAHGFIGTPEEWLHSLKGEPGNDAKPVPVEVLRGLVQAAVAEIPLALAGRDGIDGAAGKVGPRGQRGERGMEAPAATLPPLQAWGADVYRDTETRLWTRVRAGPISGDGPHINLFPIRGADMLISHIDLIPEPT